VDPLDPSNQCGYDSYLSGISYRIWQTQQAVNVSDARKLVIISATEMVIAAKTARAHT